MKKNNKTKKMFAVSWGEYNHNEDTLNCDLYGLYKTEAEARKAIEGAISADIETLLEDYEDIDPKDRPFEGKSPEKAAREIMSGFGYGFVEFELDDGRELMYRIATVGV